MSYPSGPPQATEQHCYRHADRRAGVSCQRCNRPICPSCMVNASVGFQCPECAKQGAKQQRLVDVFNKSNTPQLTYVLIGINVAIFLISLVADKTIGGSVYHTVNGRFGVYGPLIADGEWWRVITGGFLHASIIHVAMNMYVLYLIGGAMERSIGKVRFGVIYLVCLVGGSLGAILLSPTALTVGASGAIFGLFGALACLELSRGINPMKGGIGPTILLNLVITLVFSGAFGNNVGGVGVVISAGGHIGGLATGAICGALFFGINPSQARARFNALQVNIAVAAALGVVLFVAAIAAANSLSTGLG